MPEATRHYGLPSDLAGSFLTHEIPFTIGGMQIRLALKVIMFYGCCLMFGVWAIMGSWVKDSGVWILPFFIWLVCFALFFGRTSKTKEMPFSKVVALMEYMPEQSRVIHTRRTSKPIGFYKIVNIDSIDKDGLIRFSTGRVGRIYLVVGSASHLLFSDDQHQILQQVDAFWRSWHHHSEFNQITLKQPQQIHAQIQHLHDQAINLRVPHPELLDLLEEKYEIERDWVGDRFHSLHQYCMVTSGNLEHLQAACSTIEHEAQSSSLMIKSASRLDRQAAIDLLAVAYSPDHDDPVMSVAKDAGVEGAGEGEVVEGELVPA